VRYPALLAAVMAAAAFSAPSAFADSIVYEKDGNVWLANPDGSGQRQVTTAGGYTKPTQADDGTIVAVKDKLLHRMDRAGNLLNLAGESGGTGPLTPAFAPGGALVAYNYNIGTPGFSTALSHSTRQTTHEEIFYIDGWSNPSWIGNDKVLMFDGSPSFTGDTLIKTVGVSGTQTWYEDPDLSLSGGEVDTSQTRFAATDGVKIRLYRLNAPPPAIDVDSTPCELTGPVGSFFRPTWSPDGGSLAWQEDDGIWTGTFDLATCQGSATLKIPGGKAPDWGPAAVGSAGPGPGPGTGPGSGGGTALSATVPRRIRLRALLRGLNVKVTCTCTATAKLLLRGRVIGKKKKAVVGSARLKVTPTRAGKARLRRGGKTVSVRVAGAGRTVTKKVKIVR
jgi:hypothetical protein